jgi:4a-hydroxytetrahydrobiopterin dehydratase
MARLSDSEISQVVGQHPGWRVVDEEGIGKLVQTFEFKNFLFALEFASRVGALAEDADHHPRLVVEWGRVEVAWWSHEQGGIVAADVEMATEVDRFFTETR